MIDEHAGSVHGVGSSIARQVSDVEALRPFTREAKVEDRKQLGRIGIDL
jgi:hypothetical protein